MSNKQQSGIVGPHCGYCDAYKFLTGILSRIKKMLLL